METATERDCFVRPRLRRLCRRPSECSGAARGASGILTAGRARWLLCPCTRPRRLPQNAHMHAALGPDRAKLHPAVDTGEQRMVSTDTDILAGSYPGTALADQNIP